MNISESECIKNFVNSLKIVLDKTTKVPIILETPVQKPFKLGGYLEDFAKVYN
jgi:endonuclease IV